MRGLTDEDRWIVGNAIEGHAGPLSKGIPAGTEYTPSQMAAIDRLFKERRITAAGGFCLQCNAIHPKATAEGRLALELDTLARTGKVEV